MLSKMGGIFLVTIIYHHIPSCPELYFGQKEELPEKLQGRAFCLYNDEVIIFKKYMKMLLKINNHSKASKIKIYFTKRRS
jgi:hypothetical protein